MEINGKFLLQLFAGSALLAVPAAISASHLTIAEKPGEPLSLFILSGAGIILIFLGVLFVLGLLFSKRTKTGRALMVSGLALTIVGVIATAEVGSGKIALDHHDTPFPLPLILLLVFFGLGVFLLLFWSYKTGQFRKMEGVKERMLERELSFLDEREEGDPHG